MYHCLCSLLAGSLMIIASLLISSFEENLLGRASDLCSECRSEPQVLLGNQSIEIGQLHLRQISWSVCESGLVFVVSTDTRPDVLANQKEFVRIGRKKTKNASPSSLPLRLCQVHLCLATFDGSTEAADLALGILAWMQSGHWKWNLHR